MANLIKLLPDHVANQIAAGEVVQRPSSVVKELLENAIDAGAEHIKLIVKDGGKTLIQAVDDGMGMGVTDARLCFERHATSKISTADDLFKLQTKGFRGEALASIAAIAHVELHSRTSMDDVGTYLKIEGSEVVAQEVAATAKGTSIAVKHLFFNIPARRNFLKSDQVELRHIIDEFQRVALAHPDTAFQMFNNGSEYFNLPRENFRQRIVHVFGKKTNERLVPVEEETAVVKISGFICKPEYAKKSRGEQFFFANGRFIKSPYLHHAVVSAFEGLLKVDNLPGYFLRLDVDPKSIDINIHPTKTEVKFEDEHTLYATLRAAVKHSLGQFHVAPVLDFERDGTLDTPYKFKDRNAQMPTISVDAHFNPFSKGNGVSTSKVLFEKRSAEGWQNLHDFEKIDSGFSQLQVESEVVDTEIFESADESIESRQITFQLQRKYILSTVKSGLLVIDQNRAHQRILFERFLREITLEKGITQQLLFPLELQFGKKELEVLEDLAHHLTQLGFEMDFTTEGSLHITGIPANMPETSIKEVFDAILVSSLNDTYEEFSKVEWISKTMCASLAIKNGQGLNQVEQYVLINDLFACKESKLSPFQKKIYVIIGANEIENKF
ncbi:MAG: DNA mismatch repair endonuclease MutL [Bacteroidota bacterium]